jgi:hypothetical protein
LGVELFDIDQVAFADSELLAADFDNCVCHDHLPWKTGAGSVSQLSKSSK